MEREFDYLRLQTNKPLMPAVALVDSPLGTAAWIAEKFWVWSDNNGNLDSIISKDTLLTNVMLYLLGPGGIDGSFWFYRAIRDELHWRWRRLNGAQGLMRALGCLSGLNRRGDLPPSRDGMGAKLAVIGGGQMFSMKMEKIGDLAMS